ncbi:hypothetical protein LSH36_870g00002 [Paralvinella palmiformis]|uniref:Apple domain-containing protein n=1 Tax=Paralvinella palmiformis TaxID=53620 RepID=A0AAD9MRW9_9ANNE|nr:hypothetical protein LSH36_870g00002 [Paralvinella palmiformis]
MLSRKRYPGFAILFVLYFNRANSLSVDYMSFKAIYGNNVISGIPSLKIIDETSEQHCFMSCGMADSCQGYNYFAKESLCELLQSACQHGQQVISSGNVYMERLDKRFCKDQNTCYVYGNGTWDEGFEFCEVLHPDARMIHEYSEDDYCRSRRKRAYFFWEPVASQQHWHRHILPTACQQFEHIAAGTNRNHVKMRR